MTQAQWAGQCALAIPGTARVAVWSDVGRGVDQALK